MFHCAIVLLLLCCGTKASKTGRDDQVDLSDDSRAFRMMGTKDPTFVKQRVDTHFHLQPQWYADEVAKAPGGNPEGEDIPVLTVPEAIKKMGVLGISHAVVSIASPGAAMFEGKTGRDIARRMNEWLASVKKANPGRFSFFASLPSLMDVEGAVAEAEYALSKLDASGVLAFTSYGDLKRPRYLGHPSFLPLWEAMDKRKGIVFTHPSHVPYAPVSRYLPYAFLDYPQETTRMAADLVTSGTIAKVPNVKFILSHAGGTVPYLYTRIAGTGLFPALQTPVNNTQQIAAFRSFYFDLSVGTDPGQLKALLEIADPTRILFGSDTPYLPEEATGGLS